MTFKAAEVQRVQLLYVALHMYHMLAYIHVLTFRFRLV